MNEEFEYEGVWWLPDQPEKEVSGTLKFTPGEGAVLELIGSFRDIKDFGKSFTPEIILGISSKGKIVTLHRCIENKSIISSPGLTVSAFYVHVVLVGAHFEKTEDIKFKSLSVHLSHLDDWVNISGFDIQDYNKDGKVIKYKPPKPIEATLKDNCKILIDIRATYPTISLVQREATIKQRTYIEIEPTEERTFDEYLKLLHYIRNFLSLGIMKPAYPLTIEATVEINKIPLKNTYYYPPIKVFYALRDIPKAPDIIMPFDMLFSFKNISDNFELFIKNWFEKAELLEPVYNLYFGTLYNPRMYLNQTFLSLVQAAESYHRRVMRNYELPEEKHKKRLEEVFITVPEKHKEWLEEELAYSNEPTLRKRLKEILNKYSKITGSLIKNRKSFINKVVVTRNYLTHYDSNSKGQAAKGEELYHVSQKIKALIELCLLTEIGFDFDSIKKIFEGNRQYKFESSK